MHFRDNTCACNSFGTSVSEPRGQLYAFTDSNAVQIDVVVTVNSADYGTAADVQDEVMSLVQNATSSGALLTSIQDNSPSSSALQSVTIFGS